MDRAAEGRNIVAHGSRRIPAVTLDEFDDCRADDDAIGGDAGDRLRLLGRAHAEADRDWKIGGLLQPW